MSYTEILFFEEGSINYVDEFPVIDRFFAKITASNYKNKYIVKYHDNLYYVHKGYGGALGGYETMTEAKDYIIRLNNEEKDLKPSFTDIVGSDVYLYLGRSYEGIGKMIIMDKYGKITTEEI